LHYNPRKQLLVYRQSKRLKFEMFLAFVLISMKIQCPIRFFGAVTGAPLDPSAGVRAVSAADCKTAKERKASPWQAGGGLVSRV
jgi:hypothetical protein